MTTSAQQTVLTDEELRCLRAVARDAAQPSDAPTIAALAAKGMIAGIAAGAALTPAGQHAIHVSEPGRVPGIDT